MDSGNKEKLLPNPRAKANIFEILTFSWTLNLFKTGKKRDLEYTDLYTPLNEHTSSLLGNELEKRWKIELDNAKKEHRDPSLFKVIAWMFCFNILLYGLILAFVEVIIRMCQPMIIGKIISYFSPDKSNTIDLSFAYIYASFLVLSILTNIILFHFSQFGMVQCGMKMRIACCSAVYRKALRLSKTSLGETTVGQVVNLMSNDVNRFDISMHFIQFLWVGPLSAIVVTYFLWQEIGVSSLFGIAAFIGIVPIQGWLGKNVSKFRLKTASKTDERVRLMNEIISGIQVIKMFTWEKSFAYLVQLARKMEIKQIEGSLYMTIILQSFKGFHTKFALLVTILAYVLLGNNINTQKVYTIMTYHGILMTSMTVFFPQAIGMLAELLISVKRIQSFLLYEEKHSSMFLKSENTSGNDLQMSTLNINNSDHGKDVESKKSEVNDFKDSIVVTNASAKWNSKQPDNCLNKINLTIRSGSLVAVIGPVGAGKSSLIQAILEELPLTDGNIFVQGVVSYASQEPWLFNCSIQQNILFNSPMDIERYKQVLQVCALKTDLAMFPHGDRTIVGERGVSLSGGQRSRINLARAIYKQADVYLLDDPLSAVDTHVGKHLFEKCIIGYLKGKTCILITHQIQYLTNVDQIILMENANKVADGLYQELQSSGLDLTKYLGKTEKTEKVGSDNEDNISNDLETFSVISRSSSINSDAGSFIEESKLSETKTGPVEVTETRSSGTVSRQVYLSYISASGKIYKTVFLVFITILTQILLTGGDYWLKHWVVLEDQLLSNVTLESSTNSSSMNVEFSSTFLWWPLTRQLCIIVYSVLIILLILICMLKSSMFLRFFTTASFNLHNNMFNAITSTTMYFFNTNPTGRILNRFTKDIGVIDERLTVPLMDLLYMIFTLIGALVVIGITNIYLMIPTFILGIFYYYAIIFYLSTSRSIKRLEGVSRSPVFGHLSSSLQGIATIRASQAEQILSKEFDDHQNLHTSTWYLFIASSEAYGITLDMISLIYLSIITFIFLIFDSGTNGGNVGLVLTQVMGLTGSLQWGVRQSAELENQMTSVERVLEYTNIPKEAAPESSPDKKPRKEWPDRGKIIFQQFFLRYSPDSTHILKNLNIRIQPMEKVGIVGRTGAGKSSLISALFRLAINEGNIIIDDVEIHELGLRDLRSKISIIPQEPVLFSGNMRKNLDPFDEYPDHVLWDALDEVELKNVVEGLPDGLNSKMSEGGSNFSVGQRQLVCLARAIVRSNKILMLDEATANVDSQTDALIQTTIRNKFRFCTVLTVAHRLNTVMDSDKVLVMDAGTMVEFDHPHNLLKNKNGYLYKMVEQTGPATANLLRNLAAESYEKINNKSLSSIVIEDAQEDSQKNE